MKILHLTLMKKWFDLILAGKKRVEYREIKPYWTKRLLDENGKPKKFDIIYFKNGYSKGCRKMGVEWKGMDVVKGKKKGDNGEELEGKRWYGILLGKVVK